MGAGAYGSNAFSRGCMANCVQSNVDGLGVAVGTYCCTTDNCNFSSTLSSNKLFTSILILVASYVLYKLY